MKLRFYARADRLVSVPGARPTQGQPPRYVGRSVVAGKPGEGGAQYPATEEPYECNADSEAGRRLIERMQGDARDGYGLPLWPADKETAAACGVEFQAVSFADGVWAAGAASAPTKTKPSASKASE